VLRGISLLHIVRLLFLVNVGDKRNIEPTS